MAEAQTVTSDEITEAVIKKWNIVGLNATTCRDSGPGLVKTVIAEAIKQERGECMIIAQKAAEFARKVQSGRLDGECCEATADGIAEKIRARK